MRTAGIVAEFNPFHTGHAHLLRETRLRLGAAEGEETAIAAVMSGNYVQQAACAVADKWVRTRLALLGGADLILELPTLWACSSAETFARGAVTLLNASGVLDALSFGSECGDLAALQSVAEALDSEEYRSRLRLGLDAGLPFAVCRQQAAEALIGPEKARLMEMPNNNLGLEYLRSLRALDSSICPMTVLRTGAGHQEDWNGAGPLSDAQFLEQNPVLSATAIRKGLREGVWSRMEPYLPAGGAELLKSQMLSQQSLEKREWALLAKVRTMTMEDWERLPDSGAAEGLPRRLVRAAQKAGSMEEFFTLAKTRRYTRARLNRLVLWAWLGLTAADRPAGPPYLRVLGFNRRGQSLLREMKKKASLPIVTRPSRVRALGEEAMRIFQREVRCTDLYDLCLDPVPPCGREWTTDPVMLL